MTLSRGEHAQLVTKARAGITELVDQFAQGDRHARRDVMLLADKLKIDLITGRGGIGGTMAGAALSADDEAIIADYLRRHSGQSGIDHDDRENGRLTQPGPESQTHVTREPKHRARQ